MTAAGRPDRRRRGRRTPPRSGPRSRSPKGDSRVGERLTLEIGDVAHGGHCVARHEGQVVFVRHTLPGERVIAEITSGTTESKFLRADAVEVLDADPARRPAPCPYAGPGLCGGCDWQHTTPEHSRELKARVVREQLRRLAGLDLPVEVEPLPGDEDGLRWRTRIELAVGPEGRAGLRPHRSHQVLAIDDCLIAHEQVAASGVFADDWSGQSGVDVAISSTGQVALVPLPERDEAPSITERVELSDGHLDLDVSARGFWQVHPGAASTFVAHVLSELDPQEGDHLLDLYCGVGLFAAASAAAVGESGRVLGIEGDERAVRVGHANVEARSTVTLTRGDVLARLSDDTVHEALSDRVDLVVLDPPRTGAGREVIERVVQLGARTIAYVACDPAALARDLAYAGDSGYAVRSIRAFDAFPMTHHVECIAILEARP